MIADSLKRLHRTDDDGTTDSNSSGLRYCKFIDQVASEFTTVIAIAGNHEFYGGDWIDSIRVLREEYERHSNVHFMENNVLTVGDTTFIGATLWTDMNKRDPLTLHTVTNGMNDFIKIRHDGLGYTKLRAWHWVERHTDSVNYIRDQLAHALDKVVVVSHHAPSFQSIDARYRTQREMNGAYASDLSDLILDNPKIKLWIHGHTHSPHDYMIGDTRVLCNPRGDVGVERDSQEVDSYIPLFVEV
jgi:Icc-related predicted phosphoesterase